MLQSNKSSSSEIARRFHSDPVASHISSSPLCPPRPPNTQTGATAPARRRLELTHTRLLCQHLAQMPKMVQVRLDLRRVGRPWRDFHDGHLRALHLALEFAHIERGDVPDAPFCGSAQSAKPYAAGSLNASSYILQRDIPAGKKTVLQSIFLLLFTAVASTDICTESVSSVAHLFGVSSYASIAAG